MRFFNICSKLGSYICLSWLWFICCIPIVTVGASTTAYCYVLNKLIWDEEGYLFKSFMKAFKDNFIKSTIMWGCEFAFMSLLIGNIRIMWNLALEKGGAYYYAAPIYVVIAAFFTMVILYSFAYNATFEDDIKTIIKNSFLIGTRHLGYSVSMLIIDIAVLYVGFVYVPVVVMFSGAIIGYINMRLLYKVFSNYKNNNHQENENSNKIENSNNIEN